ncbi:MAG: hypothetical protein QJQ54_02390 [Mollicutes bacterium]|nr:MAG: hypothetical protein QJQ54_02390 [Mollicutes bacterium]
MKTLLNLKNQNINMSDCVHTKVGLKIRKVITIAAIISLSFLINFFGVPFF